MTGLEKMGSRPSPPCRSMTASSKNIAKWPFFLGDGICLAAMIGLLSLAERPLSGGVAAAAVVCLIVGIALTLVPFLVENENRVRLAESNSNASGGGQLRKLSALAEQLSNSVSRSQSSAEQVERALATVEESNERLAELVENLGRVLDGAPSTGGELSRVADTMVTLSSGLEALQSKVDDLGRHRALTAEELEAALAVWRRPIEESAARISSPPTGPIAKTEPRPAPDPVASVGAPDDPDPTNPAATAAKRDPRPPARRPKTGPKAKVSDDDSSDPGLGIDLPDEKGSRYVFNDQSTSIIATAYIGIGNKLTIRGTGPGLSWEKGVPMQFLSIGKWGWSALDVAEPIICRIYRNDDEPSLDGDIELQPTELKEISPRF